MALTPDSRLGPYVVTAKIGEGGMGEVYRARDEQLDRDVAIKVLPASSFEDPVARARLLQEARAAAALNHPHICTVYEVGEADGQIYIVMELVDGQPLSERRKGEAYRPTRSCATGVSSPTPCPTPTSAVWCIAILRAPTSSSGLTGG